jgi:hypothetical protein
MLHNISKVQYSVIRHGTLTFWRNFGMALKDTIKTMRHLLDQISSDLPKAENGNKAASQRVRTGTVRLEKVAKLYRKESIKTEKTTKGKKRPAAKKAAKKPADKKTTKAAKKSPQKKTFKNAKAKSMSKARHTMSHPSPLSVKRSTAAKRPTAKLARKPMH